MFSTRYDDAGPDRSYRTSTIDDGQLVSVSDHAKLLGPEEDPGRIPFQDEAAASIDECPLVQRGRNSVWNGVPRKGQPRDVGVTRRVREGQR